MNLLVSALLYSLHVIALPSGWSVAQPWSTGSAGTRPVAAAIARNGTVAVLLVRTGQPLYGSQRLFIVRRDGSHVILRPEVKGMLSLFAPDVRTSDCAADSEACPLFEGVTLASDGTPFVTVGHHFEGAYSGMRRSAFVWNGEWHPVPPGDAFAGFGNPNPPDNISIAAADTASRFAYVGDYEDSPGGEIELGFKDPTYMADVSGLQYEPRAVALGVGDATAVRGAFVAGFDAGLRKYASHPDPAIAFEWHCVREQLVHAPVCARIHLGRGVAYGVDSRGNAVGDNEASWPERNLTGELLSFGSPTLWRGGYELQLSTRRGCAYAISEGGTIVGATVDGPNTSGFVASSRDNKPYARPLDPLVAGIGDFHVRAAIGIADDGHILVFLSNNHQNRVLAVLTPLHS